MGWPLRKGAKYNEFGGSFIYPMGEDKLCIGMVAGLDYTDATFSCHDLLQQLKTHPFVREAARRAASGSAGARRRSPPAATGRCRSKLAVPGHGDVRRQRLGWSTSRPEGRSTTRCTPGCTRPRRSSSALKKDPDSVNFAAYEEQVRELARSRRTSTSRATCASTSTRGSSSAARSPTPMTITKGALPRRPLGRRARRRASRCTIGKAPQTLPQAGRRVHLRQALLGLPLGQRDPRRRPEPRPDPDARPARGRPDLGLDVPGAGLRDPRGPARERRRRRSTSTSTASNCVQCGAITAKGGRLTLPEGGDGPLYQEV